MFASILFKYVRIRNNDGNSITLSKSIEKCVNVHLQWNEVCGLYLVAVSVDEYLSNILTLNMNVFNTFRCNVFALE